jgi:hypothetical protein
VYSCSSFLFFPLGGCIVTFSFPCPFGKIVDAWADDSPNPFFLSTRPIIRVRVFLCVWPLLIYTYNEVQQQQQITVYYELTTLYSFTVQMLPVSLSLCTTSFSDSFLFLATFYRRVEKERVVELFSILFCSFLYITKFIFHFFYVVCVPGTPLVCRLSCVCVVYLVSSSFCTIFFFSFLGRWQLFVCRL